MAKETPLQAVKRLYGSKEKLIEQLVDVARESEEESTDVVTRLGSVSNKKLLRLAAASKRATDQYGGRDQLVASLSKSLGKDKDKDYQDRLRGISTPRLLDMARAADRRAKSS